MKRWYDFRAQAKGAEIAIYEEIGAFRRLGHLLQQPREDRDHPGRRPDRGRRSDHRRAHRPDRCAVCRHHVDRPGGRRYSGRLEFAYSLSAQAKLVLTAHEVYLPKPKLAVEGPGGVQASFDFRGAKNDVAGRMLTVTLTNDLDGTVYA